jgi:hypothetical protein
MFGFFSRKKVKLFVLIAAMASIATAAERGHLASAKRLDSEKGKIAASAPENREEQKNYETIAPLGMIFGTLQKSGVKEASEGRYDKAIDEIKLMRKFCEYSGTDTKSIRDYARKIILEMIHNANKAWKRGDVKSASEIYKKAKEAAELGEQRWAVKIDHMIKKIESQQLVMK